MQYTNSPLKRFWFPMTTTKTLLIMEFDFVNRSSLPRNRNPPKSSRLGYYTGLPKVAMVTEVHRVLGVLRVRRQNECLKGTLDPARCTGGTRSRRERYLTPPRI